MNQDNRILAYVAGEKLTAEEMAIISGGVMAAGCPKGEEETHIRGTSTPECDKPR